MLVKDENGIFPYCLRLTNTKGVSSEIKSQDNQMYSALTVDVGHKEWIVSTNVEAGVHFPIKIDFLVVKDFMPDTE